jgi:iron complex transport system ATP-binding protein
MILEVDGVRFAYRSDDVLKDVCFKVERREVFTILGPNGVGKTTLLKCINRIISPKVGTIMVDGVDCSDLDRNNLARRIGYVPQRAEVTKIKVYDAVLLGRKPYITWDLSQRDRGITDEVIFSIGLIDIALRDIDEISGGELQKVQIARALVQEPKLLLLDEPTSMLDIKNQHCIMRTIVNAVKERGLSAVMTLHDINLALRYSDKFILMEKGTIKTAGGPEMINPDSIREVYDIEVDVIAHNGYRMVVPL